MTTRTNDIETKAKAKLRAAKEHRDLAPEEPAPALRYELHIDTNNAALTRFATALLTTRCTLLPRGLRLSGQLGRGITQCLMVDFPDVETAERFRERCKPQDMFLAKVATPQGGMRVCRPTKGDE